MLAVALDKALKRMRATRRAGEASRLQLHQPLSGEPDRLAKQIGVGDAFGGPYGVSNRA